MTDTNMKVFGIGQMKTGTTTLGHCLSTFGFRHRSYYPKLLRQAHRGDYSNVWDVVDRYDSFEDNPWPLLYQQLDERYPDSKFVLTTRRDSETWFGSMVAHARRRGPTAEKQIIYGHGWPARHKQDFIANYEAHNESVKAHFADRPDKLLQVCWETGSTMTDLASFLGLDPELAEELPRLNSASASTTSTSGWIRNTTKYVLISKLRIDPFRYRGFDA
ncbi:MAG: hypothetical protein HKN91_13345 [Acidimicrobiia bacterium]|nr:hypothetical protein [Acidimicrobiia bacterium]